MKDLQKKVKTGNSQWKVINTKYTSWSQAIFLNIQNHDEIILLIDNLVFGQIYSFSSSRFTATQKQNNK